MKLALEHIHHRINLACERSGRPVSEVDLLLASKMQSVDVLREARALGHRLFGENKVQEARPKFEALSDEDFVWHFIGHLQSNKAKYIVPYVSCVHSVDRVSLIDALDDACRANDATLDVLVEVNTSGEASKQGCKPADVEMVLAHIASKSTLRTQGFMTIGALSDDEREVRRCFSDLRNILDRSHTRGLIPSDARTLSMGMSGDLELAIAEGATIIRVGSAVFGERNYGG